MQHPGAIRYPLKGTTWSMLGQMTIMCGPLILFCAQYFDFGNADTLNWGWHACFFFMVAGGSFHLYAAAPTMPPKVPMLWALAIVGAVILPGLLISNIVFSYMASRLLEAGIFVWINVQGEGYFVS